MSTLSELLQLTAKRLEGKLSNVDIVSIVPATSLGTVYVIAVGALDEGIKTAVLSLRPSEVALKLEDTEISSASLAWDIFNIIDAGGNDDSERFRAGNGTKIVAAIRKAVL